MKEKQAKRKNKLIFVVICSLLIAMLCVPIKYRYKDGGTVAYRALLYSYTEYHKLQNDGSYYDKSEFLFFPFNFLH